MDQKLDGIYLKNERDFISKMKRDLLYTTLAKNFQIDMKN